jgi:hypothetical protein
MNRHNRAITVGLLLSASCLAQDPPPVGWSAGKAEQLLRYSNPVVSTYSLARLGSLVCPHDKGAGSALFLQSLRRMEDIKTEIFFDPKTPLLPVASFTKLWAAVSANAVRCDPALKPQTELTNRDSVRARLANERAAATNNVMAVSAKADDPARQAQMVYLLLEAGDPAFIDYNQIGNFVAVMRDRSAELGDEMFRYVLETIVSAPERNTDRMNVLAKYLFISRELRPKTPDKANAAAITPDGRYIFEMLRLSTNTDLVEEYAASLLRMVEGSLNPAPNDLRQNAQFSAATAIQIIQSVLPHARFLELTLADDLNAAIPKLQAAMKGQNLNAPPQSGAENDAYRESSLYFRTRAVLNQIGKGEFEAARQALNGLGDGTTMRQISSLIAFAEALEAIKQGDLTTAVRLAAQVQPPGVARSLLYNGILARGARQEWIGIAMSEVTPLLDEYRSALASSIAIAVLELDPNQSTSLLKLAIEAQNSARLDPRTWRFDPRRLRCPARCPAGVPGEGTQFDIPSILGSKNGFNFPLNVPGTGPFTLTEALRRAKSVDLSSLEAIVADLRDEAQRAEALLALAERLFGAPERSEVPLTTQIR